MVVQCRSHDHTSPRLGWDLAQHHHHLHHHRRSRPSAVQRRSNMVVKDHEITACVCVCGGGLPAGITDACRNCSIIIGILQPWGFLFFVCFFLLNDIVCSMHRAVCTELRFPSRVWKEFSQAHVLFLSQALYWELDQWHIQLNIVSNLEPEDCFPVHFHSCEDAVSTKIWFQAWEINSDNSWRTVLWCWT